MAEVKPWHRHYDYNVPTTVRYPRLPVHELLGIPANAFPDKAVLNFYGTEITLWELRLQVLRFAAALGGLGVQKGDRVALHLLSCPQYPIACYAALSMGAIIAFCNEKLAAYKVPKKVEFRMSLPKSAIGKVLRKVLREEEEAKSRK